MTGMLKFCSVAYSQYGSEEIRAGHDRLICTDTCLGVFDFIQ